MAGSNRVAVLEALLPGHPVPCLIQGMALGCMVAWLPGGSQEWVPWVGVAIMVVLTPWQVWALVRAEQERRTRTV